jgi:hypothetical protein
MPSARKVIGPTAALPLDQAMVGVLAMLIAEREDRLNPPDSPRKTEFILATAGLDAGTIAMLTGKTYDSVQKAIARSKPKLKPRSKRASEEKP